MPNITMNELGFILQTTVDGAASIENDAGVEITAVYYHPGMKRLSFSFGEDPSYIELAPGWICLWQE